MQGNVKGTHVVCSYNNEDKIPGIITDSTVFQLDGADAQKVALANGVNTLVLLENIRTIPQNDSPLSVTSTDVAVRTTQTEAPPHKYSVVDLYTELLPTLQLGIHVAPWREKHGVGVDLQFYFLVIQFTIVLGFWRRQDDETAPSEETIPTAERGFSD